MEMTPEIPDAALFAALNTPAALLNLWLLHLLRRETGGGRPEAPPPPPAPDALARAREELAAFKLEVARSYVPLSLIRDLDSRLSLHLIRIEEKLEEVSRAATSALAHAERRP